MFLNFFDSQSPTRIPQTTAQAPRKPSLIVSLHYAAAFANAMLLRGRGEIDSPRKQCIPTNFNLPRASFLGDGPHGAHLTLLGDSGRWHKHK